MPVHGHHFLVIIDNMLISQYRTHRSLNPGRFAPLNRYYIIIDEVFFDNFGVIIYLLVVCKKNNNSFILVYFNYLFISCIQQNNNSFILVCGILLSTKGRIFFSKKNHCEGVQIHLCVQNGNKIRRNRLTETSNSPSYANFSDI